MKQKYGIAHVATNHSILAAFTNGLKTLTILINPCSIGHVLIVINYFNSKYLIIDVFVVKPKNLNIIDMLFPIHANPNVRKIEAKIVNIHVLWIVIQDLVLNAKSKASKLNVIVANSLNKSHVVRITLLFNVVLIVKKP